MGVNVRPQEQLEFHGVNLDGNPIMRPSGTAQVCENFRVMPGRWLRLAGGRKARYLSNADAIQQIHPFRQVGWWGAQSHLAQLRLGSASYWSWFDSSTYVIDTPGIEQISMAYDSSWCLTHPAAVCNLPDRPLFYNGLGVMDSYGSRPPFSTYYQGVVRYFGLDAHCPSGNPSVSFAAGAGYNQVLTSVKLYVGLYSLGTEHYSNVVEAGEITETGDTGTITVQNLDRLKAAYHSIFTDGAALYFVFYATIDGGQVPYLIMNSSMTGPETCAINQTSHSLSLANGTTNGWVLDETMERPLYNFPPKPMRSICYVNGRLYGALMTGGSGSRADFGYGSGSREQAAVVWSAADGDYQDAQYPGDPLQSWPVNNMEYTPSFDQPVALAPAMDNARVLVITPTATFLLEEQVDGIHEFITVSLTHGILNPTTLKGTRYGYVWVDQRNQVVLLPPNSLEIQVLSKPYQDLMNGTVSCADYLYNPKANIDRYEVFFSEGASVCHDFEVGEAYTCTGKDFTAACSVVDHLGKIHHIVASKGIYTQEAQPDTGLTPTYNETYVSGVVQSTEINGTWIANWDDRGDADVRKEIPHIDVLGDPVAKLSWWGDFEERSDVNEKLAISMKTAQSTTDSMYRHKLSAANRFWMKIKIYLAGHSSSLGSYTALDEEGDQARDRNFYGSIMRVLFRVARTENRA